MDQLFHTWTDNGRVWAVVSEGTEPVLLTDSDHLQVTVDTAIKNGVTPAKENIRPGLVEFRQMTENKTITDIDRRRLILQIDSIITDSSKQITKIY